MKFYYNSRLQINNKIKLKIKLILQYNLKNNRIKIVINTFQKIIKMIKKIIK